MPVETALERLRRLAGAPAASDATAVKPPARIVRKVTALPEDPDVLARTQAEEDAARGKQLRRERRDWPDALPPTPETPAKPQRFPRPNPLVAASDASRIDKLPPVSSQRTIGSRDEFEKGSEADADRLLGMSDRLERAAPYRPANEKAKLLSVGRRLGEESSILSRRPGKATDAAMSAANMATLGLPEVVGLDRSGSVEPEKARRLAANAGVTPDELRETGAIGEDDLVPRTLTTDSPSIGRQLGNMAGGFAGLMLPLGAEKAVVGGVLRNAGVRGAEGFSRVNKVAQGIEREQRYLNPRTGVGRLVRNATEFAVPGAIYDANSALANGEDVGDRVKSGLLTNVVAGAALPVAFEGAGKVVGKTKPAFERLRELAGEAKTALADSRVPAREGKYEFSSTQLDLPENSANAVKALANKIPDEDLAEKGRVGEVGTSEGPHVTVKYGLHGNDPEQVRQLLKDQKPITVKMGKTSVFENGESGNGDVVKVDVDSPELRELNAKIADALPHTDTHPTYQPHATVAYVKPGLGKKYAGDAALEGHTVTIDKLTFSGADGSLHEIPLGQKSAIDRLREFAEPAIALDKNPTLKKAALTGAAAYAAGNMKGLDEDGSKSPLALGALAIGSLATHEGARLLKSPEAPTFFSRLDKHIAKKALDIKNPKPVEFWDNFFKRGGDFSSKEVELRLRGALEEARDEGRQLTGADIKKALDENPLQIRAHVIGSPLPSAPPETDARAAKYAHMTNEQLWMREHELSRIINTAGGGDEDEWMAAYNELANITAERVSRRNGPSAYVAPEGYSQNPGNPRYSQYSEPGGENYREIVLQANPTKPYKKKRSPLEMPEGFVVRDRGEHQPSDARYVVDFKTPAEGFSYGSGATPEAAVASFRENYPHQSGQKAHLYGPQNYDEAHYGSANEGIENVIGHVRLKTRTIDGKKTLYIEEVQSSAGQDRAKYGSAAEKRKTEQRLEFEADRNKEHAQAIQRRINTLTAQVNDPAFAGQRRALAQEKKRLMSELGETQNRAADFAAQLEALHETRDVPENLPFTADMGEYTDAMLRTVLDVAAREGHEKIVWTTGSQQAERYAAHLRKTTDHLVYEPEGGKLTALKKGDVVAEHEGVSPTKLEAYIGKSAAKDLLESKKRKWKDGFAHQIKGEGIRFNSPGMVNYYDEVIPNWFKKEARKHGVQIEVKQHEVPETVKEFEPADDIVIGRPANRELYAGDMGMRLDQIAHEYGGKGNELSDVTAGAAKKLRDALNKARDEWDAGASQVNATSYNGYLARRVREAFHNDLTERERVLLDNTDRFNNEYHGFYLDEKGSLSDFSIDEVHDAYNNLRSDVSSIKSMDGYVPEQDYTALRAFQKLRRLMSDGDTFQEATQKLPPVEREQIAHRMPGADTYSASGGPVMKAKVPVNLGFDVPPELAEKVFNGQVLYANPFLNPQLIAKMAKAHPTIFRGAAVAGAGYGVEQAGEATDNERLKWSGMGIISLGALHALGAHSVNGKPLYKAASEFAGKKIAAGIKDEKFGPLKGKDILNWISYDILATPELRAAADEYERDVAKGAARAAEFAAKMRRLGPIGERYATDLITQEQWEKQVAKLSPEEKKKVFAAAQALMNEFHDLGELEVKYGTLARGQFDKYDGQYIPYLYALHEADAARGVGGGPLPTMKPKTREHRSRQDLPRTTRENLGQIRESSYLAEQGIEKGYRNVAAAKLFSALSSMPGALHPEYEQAVKDLIAAQQSSRTGAIKAAKRKLEFVRNAAKGGYDRGQLAGYKTLTNAKGYGVLAGAVVRKDIAEYLEGLPHFGEKNLANDLFQQWKKIHTVFNPGTHLGNFVSNITTVHMKGLPVHEQPKALSRAYDEIKQYGTYARALAEAGVMDRNIATMDYSGNMLPSVRSRVDRLRDLANRTTRETRQVLSQREIDPTGPQPGQSLVHAMGAAAAEEGGKVSDKLAKWYNLEDNVFRVALLQKVTKSERAGGLGLNMEQGVEYVRHHMGDFRTRSKALSLARWYSPFIMYPAKMLPHMVGSIIEHPTRWMTLAAGWGVLDQLGAYATGTGALPSIDSSGIHIGEPGKRIKTGQIDTMDMAEDQRPSRGFGYVVPGPLQAPLKRGKNRFAVDISRWTPFSALSGQPSPGSMAAAVSSRIPAIVSPGGPLSDIFARTQVNADPYTGEEWINPSESPGKKTAKIVGGLVANQVLPSALAWHLPRFAADLADKSYDKAVIDALGFAGARPRTIIPGQRLQQDEYWRQDEREAATRALNKRMRETKDKTRRNQAKVEFNERLDRIEREFKRRNTRPK